MDERKLSSRTVIMAVIIFICISICVLNLINLQVVNGATYLSEAEKVVITTSYTTVNAARGEVFDRNGVPLITNRTVYSLGFKDIRQAEDDVINSTIFELLKLCDLYGAQYNDTLPLSAGAYYLSGASVTNRERFDSYKAYFGWDQDLSGPEVMKKMLSVYGLTNSSYDKDTLRKILGVRYELTLRNVLNIAPYIFCEDVGTQMIAAVQERGFSLVSVIAGSERVYNTKYAAHILGRLGHMTAEDYERLRPLGYDMDELIGKGGIEEAFEEYLHGKRGLLETKTNANGEIVSERYVKEPQAGSDVYLTVDIGMQAVAEDSLKACIEKLRETADSGAGQEAGGGAVVAIDVNTFEVLALASYPTYDLASYSENYNDLVEDPLKPLLNRATQGTYEPGSTFKMVTATAALESGAIKLDTHITDNGVYMYYAPSYTPVCWIHTKTGGTHGTINVIDALKVSCNYFFYESARLTGIQTIDRYAAAFGLGQKTGIEIDESLGILAGPEARQGSGRAWTGGDTIQAGIGQSDNAFTPLQLACYVASVSNGGNRYAAHLMNFITSRSSPRLVQEHQSSLLSKTEISDETYQAVMDGMLEASVSGTASAVFANYPIKVASKTGSAQTSLRFDNAVFVCCAPRENPEIAIVVIVEKGGQGGLIGSVAKDVLDYYCFSPDASAVQPDNSLVR